MNKLDRIGKWINWIVFAYLLGISVLPWMGKLSYGAGMGDVIFIILTSAFTITHFLILVIFIHARREPVEKGIALLIGILFMLLAVAFTYKFTIGRGVESPWDGNVFQVMNKLRHTKEKKLENGTSFTDFNCPGCINLHGDGRALFAVCPV
jgi:hypothetical protein